MKKTLLTILATTAAISASAATVKDLSDKEVLTIDANTTWYGTTGQSPINVPGNTRAVINIKKGVTLTVYGADASGQTFGVPAIYVPPTATLYITGEGGKRNRWRHGRRRFARRVVRKRVHPRHCYRGSERWLVR